MSFSCYFILTLWMVSVYERSGIEGSSWYLGCYQFCSPVFTDDMYWAVPLTVVTPPICSRYCLEKGYSFTALRNSSCFCATTFTFLSLGNQSYSLSICGSSSEKRFNGSSFSHNSLNCLTNDSSICLKSIESDVISLSTADKENKDRVYGCVKKCFNSLCLPYGDGVDNLALYNTLGPYVKNISLRLVTEQLQIEKLFVLELSGYLASSLDQSTGIRDLNRTVFSLVKLALNWTSDDQFTYSVPVLPDGSFTASLSWVYTKSGTYQINASVMNLLSIQESHIEVTSLNPVPALLEVKVMQTPEQVPSCITFPVDRATSLEKVFLGELCIFNAFVSIGTHLKFHWHFTDNNITHILGGECSRMENCLSNTVNHTFEKEGVYIVAVNVSNVYGWVEKIISVAVVPQIISNLTFNIMGEHLVRLGENVTFEMELFTTVRQLLFLNATFETGITHTYWLSDDSPAFETNNYLQLLESYGLQHCIFRVRITHQYSKPGCSDVSATVFSPTMMVSVTLPEKLEVYDTIWNIIPSVLWDTVIPSGINTTFLISSSTDKTGSFVSWRITKDNYTLVNTTTSAWSFTYSFQDSGIYNLMAIAFNPLSEVSVVSELIVQEAISGLSLFSENPTCITTGSAVAIWASIQKGVNVTYTWDFDTNTSFFTGNLQAASYHYTEPGIYFVTVKAENEVSSISSEALQILVQDQASGLLIHIPSIITVEESSLLTITVMTGTNLTLDILTNGTLAFTQNGYVAGIPINVEFVFNQTGSLQVVVKARNCVSTLTKTLAVLVVREISTITIEATQLPVFGEGIILIAKVNGIIWANRNYIYTWTLPQNITILSGSPAFLYNCSHTDSQLITVSVTNCASNASSELELNISLANVGPRLFHEANVGAGTTVVFTLKAFYANEESFDIYFGDGNMNTLLCPTERNLSCTIQYTYSSAGIYRVKVESTKGTNISSVIIVQEYIKDLLVIGPKTWKLTVSEQVPSSVTWTAQISQGSNCIYQWTFLNGTVKTMYIGLNMFTMELQSPSELNGSVTVKNDISELSADFFTVVQFPIQKIILAANQVALGQLMNIMILAEPAQNYDVFVSFGDGHYFHSSSMNLSPDIKCNSQLSCTSQFQVQHQYSDPGIYNLSVVLSNSVSSATEASNVVVEEIITGIQVYLRTPTVIRVFDFINATASVKSGSDVTFEWQVLNSSPAGSYYFIDRNTSFSYLSFLTLNPGNYVVTVNISNPFYKAPFTRVLPNPVKVCGPIQSIQAEFPLGVNYAELIKQHDGTYATPWLSFTVYSHLEDVSFLYNFDDGTLVSNVNRSRKDVGGISASCYHSFKLAGVFRIRITVYNEFFNATKELGPYYVEILPKGLSIYVNCSVVHKNDIVLFNATVKEGTNVSYTWKMDDQTTYVNKGPVILHRFLTSSVYNVSAIAQNRVGTAISSTSISVLYRMQPVYVYSNQTIYATDTDIIFQAVTNERGSLNFVWYFGDKPPQQTSSPTIKTQYSTANRYNVFVTASNNLSSFTSDIYPITIEKKISLNRLLFNASVLVNCSVVMDCRINAASNASFLWNFGDGTVRTGKTIENHTYKREGEFTVEVTVFNHISSASLSKQIFVLSAPCQPPPVKNMGPSKVQVRRYQNLVLGVTFEADIQCSTFRGITYKWNLYDSSGVSVTFLQIDTNKQTIEIPKHFLSYGNYTAVAKVQVIGSVVYSNYTVPIEVLPTSPVSVIRGGTNVFFSKNNDSLITLDGRDSYDPDYPENRISFIWTCMPVSRISSGCFDKSIILNLAVVTFTASSLKSDFDQFQFTLRVNSGSRSSTSDVFVNFQKNIQIELGISCAKCKGNTINWNERFSVTAECGICKNILNHTLVWSMYLVNASSTPNVEVPFCKVLDTNSPSSLYQSIFVSAPKESPSQASSFYSSSSVSTSNIVPATSSLASADETLERSTTAFPVNQRVLSGITFSDLFASQAMFPLLEDKTTSKQATTSKDLYDLPILIMEGPASGGRSRRKRSNAVSPTSTAIRGVTAVDASTKDTSTALVAKENGNPKDSLLSISISGTILEELSPEMGEFPIVSEGASITTISVISSSNRIRLNEEKVSNLVNQTLSVNITDPYDFYKGIEEGGGNYDRPTGGSFNNANSEPIYDSSKGGGSNLIDNSNNLSVGPLTSTLLDLDRRQIDDNLFTVSGESSLSITFQPFTLQPGMLYLIELSADLDQQQLGKTQLFFFTNEAPQGMTCLLQPKKGFEIYTDFSIFCTSGKEDLSYKYSYQVGNNSKTILYQGRDIQYYFNLPAGDPSDNYKVTIYIEIGNRFGSTTSPCPAVVTVLPSFLRNETSSYNPDAELYYLVMRNLSSHLLIQNDLETRNYIILLTNVLNRLSQDQRGDRDLHIQVQKALISAVCGLNVNSQAELLENLNLLQKLLSTRQQIISIAKTVVLYIKSLTQHFLPSDSTKTFELDEQTLRILISMISKSLMVRNNGTEESMQMLTDGIRTTTELLLIYTLSNNRTNVKLITDFMELETFQSEDFQNIVRRAGSITFYLPVSLSSLAVLNENCIISQVIFIKGNPYSWGQSSVKINENVADLTLYNCKTRRKIDVNGLTSPVIIEFQKNEINETSELNFSLLQDKMNIHQFNVTSDKQTEYLQITLNFTRPPERVFPIMILYRKFEKPTPRLYNFQQVFQWKGNTVQLFLSPDSLNAKGSYYLALLSANYDRKPTNKYTASAVSYSLSIQWISCLYWDNVKEWKTDGCLPMQSLSSSKLNCSCHHLTAFSMSSRDARNCFESINMSPFQSQPDNLVPCIVIFFTLIIYIPLAFLCKRFDIQNEKKRAPVYLQDNNPSDKQLYAICIDTGFRSRTYTTAKICIVLHGEDGVSETRELHCPQKTLFERNSRDIFIMSTPYTLGPIWRIQLWHNNGGHSPSWYLSHVIVKDLTDGTCWFFMAETWLAVDEGDGKVERDLTPLRKCPGFKKVLYCKLTEFLEDFHIWASVYSRPSHSHFSHSQRLAVCLFLFLGYMTLNSVILFLKDEEYSAELGLINTSTFSLITGCFSVIAVLPVGLLLSLLFRFSKVKFSKESPVEQLSSTEASAIYNVEVHRNSVILQDGTFESYLSWQNLQMWAEEAWKKKFEHGLSEHESHVYSKTFRKERGLYSSDDCSSGFEDCSLPENKVPAIISSNDLCSVYSSEHGSLYEQPVFSDNKTFLPYWCQYAAWSICILLSVICIVVTVCVGLTFNLTKCICWIHSLFFSLLFCIFVLQPILIFITAVAVTLKCKDISSIYVGFHKTNPNFESRKWQPSKDSCQSKKCLPTFDHKQLASSLDYDKLIAARQRSRYLRLVRPPSHLQLKEARERIRKEALIQQTLRKIILHTLLLLLLLFITYGRFSTNQHLVNRSIHHNFIRNAKIPFTELNNTKDWWNWSLTSLINGLCYDSFCKNAVTNIEAVPARGLFKLIGEPVLWKIHAFDKTDCNILRVYKDFSFSRVPPDNSTIYNTRKQTFVGIFNLCGQIECYNERKTALTLGRTRTEMIDILTQLKSVGWLDKNTKAVVVQFTLYNPPSNLFTTVSFLMEISAGTVFSSTLIESANVYQIISIFDYLIMAFELLFLILIFLQLYFQICTMIIQGFIVYWQESWNWLEMVIIVTGLFRFLYYIYQFHLVMEVIDELQKQNFMTFIDIRILSYVEQLTRSLQGIVIFLLLVKYIHMFRVNKVMGTCVARLRLSSFNTVISVLTGLIIIIAYTCLGNLLFMTTFHPFSTTKRSFQTLLSQFLGACELKTLSSLYHTNQLSLAIFSGTFFFFITIFWTAMIIGTFTSFSHDAKKSSRSKHFITFKEVVIYARERFFNYVSGRGQKLFDNFSIMNNNYYLDEFETLMDELLFRLNSLSNSLYHFLPAKQRFYLEEDSTITYQSDCYFTQDSENSLLNGDCFETPFHNIQQDMLRDHLQLYDLFMQSASCLNHSLMDERVRLEMEEAAFHHLQMNKLSRAVLGYSSLNNLGQAQSQNALDSSSSTTKHQSLIEAASQSLANLNSCEVAHQTQNLNSNLAVNHELYNLTKLGSAFPHILCGRKCSEKAFLMPTMQQPISAGLTTKGRKLLRRSQATVINPLEIQRDLTKGIAENNSKFTRNSEKKKGLINKTIVNNTDFSSVGSKRKHQGGEETVISKTEYKEQKIENETCRISALNDKRDTCMQKDHLDLPGSIRPCW